MHSNRIRLFSLNHALGIKASLLKRLRLPRSSFREIQPAISVASLVRELRDASNPPTNVV
jgi:hypothetical protein